MRHCKSADKRMNSCMHLSFQSPTLWQYPCLIWFNSVAFARTKFSFDLTHMSGSPPFLVFVPQGQVFPISVYITEDYMGAGQIWHPLWDDCFMLQSRLPRCADIFEIKDFQRDAVTRCKKCSQCHGHWVRRHGHGAWGFLTTSAFSDSSSFPNWSRCRILQWRVSSQRIHFRLVTC